VPEVEGDASVTIVAFGVTVMRLVPVRTSEFDIIDSRMNHENPVDNRID
jgi:hypothetical protein